MNKYQEENLVERLQGTILGHAKPQKVVETPVYEYTGMVLQ
jgi:hypothetical protein